MIEKDYGFILKRHNFRETSLIATIYTRRFGKISGIFKGFYTNKKEYSSPLGLFSLNEFVFYPKNNDIWLVSHADLLEDYSFPRTNIQAAKIGGFFLKVVDRAMQLWDRNIQIFDLLQRSFISLESEKELKVFYVFLIKFLTFSGFRPELNRCIICSCNLGRGAYFSASRGGLICPACRPKVKDAKAISPQVSKSILYIQSTGFPLVYRLSFSSRSEKEMFVLLKEFFNYHFEYKDLILPSFLLSGQKEPSSCV
ncbi:MAG: DNA repair protein RecO [Candidatus Omnitrophica bacterium]|nr:DNA repair protein RecO [Candidatus Omnitrophota bacterium]MBD3269606.1 DNA repair protein RecO [Candidatus Omnitrophota bacterium]